MRRSFITLILGTLLATFVVATSEQLAYACSYDEPFSLPVDVFGQATDLDNLNASAGPVRDAYDAWTSESEWRDPLTSKDALASIVSVRQLTTVIHLDPPDDHYASTAGVVVFDAIWGETPADVSPRSYRFDTTSCAGLFEPPALGASEWVIETEPTEWFWFSPADFEVVALEVELTRLFGEPLRPEPDLADVDAAFREVLRDGQQQFDEPIGSIAWLEGFEDPTASTQLDRDGDESRETTSVRSTVDSQGNDSESGSGLPPFVLWPSLAVPAAALFVLAVLGWRRLRGR